MSPTVKFVLHGPDGRLDTRSSTRRMIRSHVMQRWTSRRARNQPPASWPPQYCPTGALRSSATAARQKAQSKSQDTQAASTTLPITAYPLPALATFPFVEPVKPYMLDLIYRYFNYMKREIYPCKWCLKYNTYPSIWFEYLMMDPLYLHSVLFSASFVQESLAAASGDTRLIRNNDPRRGSRLHFDRTVKLLRARVEDDSGFISDSTISVVIVMTLYSAMFNDFAAATSHVKGLKTMVQLRGGFKCLITNPHLPYLVCLADILLTLLMLRQPLFTEDEVQWESAVPGLDCNQVRGSSILPYWISKFVVSLEAKLAHVLYELAALVQTARLLRQGNSTVDPDSFRQTKVKLMYKVMTITLSSNVGTMGCCCTIAENTWIQCLRLGMLAFSASVFVQLETTKIKCRLLKQRLQQSLLSLKSLGARSHDLQKAESNLMLWLTMVALVTFDFEDDSDSAVGKIAKVAANGLGLREWDECKALLNSILWVDELFDLRGRKVFYHIIAPSVQEVE
ncbi:hypothetical protein BX600DRAFT_285408 [Xylariales sp. PMI_506]|nr:hypothetical protein BX600DRAFT_285408 [Xylariales sp. PMI_506]